MVLPARLFESVSLHSAVTRRLLTAALCLDSRWRCAHVLPRGGALSLLCCRTAGFRRIFTFLTLKMIAQDTFYFYFEYFSIFRSTVVPKAGSGAMRGKRRCSRAPKCYYQLKHTKKRDNFLCFCLIIQF